MRMVSVRTREAYSITAGPKREKKLDVDYCKHNIVYHFVLPLKRDLWMCSVCRQKLPWVEGTVYWYKVKMFSSHYPGPYAFDPSRSEYMRFTVNYRDRQKGTSPSPFQQWITVTIHTHCRGYQAPIMTLIEKKVSKTRAEKWLYGYDQ